MVRIRKSAIRVPVVRRRPRLDGSEKVGALRAVPTFAECSVAELKLVDSLTFELHMPPYRVLAEEGHRADQVLVIVDGFAAVECGEMAIGTVGPGACIGAAEAIDRRSHAVTVIADGPVTVRVANPREFAALLHAIPRLAAWVDAGLDMQLDVARVGEATFDLEGARVDVA